jgi:hypothetical protein
MVLTPADKARRAHQRLVTKLATPINRQKPTCQIRGGPGVRSALGPAGCIIRRIRNPDTGLFQMFRKTGDTKRLEIRPNLVNANEPLISFSIRNIVNPRQRIDFNDVLLDSGAAYTMIEPQHFNELTDTHNQYAKPNHPLWPKKINYGYMVTYTATEIPAFLAGPFEIQIGQDHWTRSNVWVAPTTVKLGIPELRKRNIKMR